MNYADVVAEIARLEKEAKKLRQEELSSVVKVIKQHIAHYGITAEDLGFDVEKRSSRRARAESLKEGRKKLVKRPSGFKRKVSPKYRDEAGNTWSGRGKKPKWVVAALNAGRTLESLLIL